MKFLLLLLPVLLSAQETKVSESQIRFAPPAQDSLMVLSTDGSVNRVKIDGATLVLDKSTTPWTLRVIGGGGGGGGVSGVYWEDVQPQWVATSARQWTWQSDLAAVNVFLVVRNGAVMRKNTDYTVTGKTLTFTAQQDSVSGDYILIKMMSLSPITLSAADVPKPVTAQNRGPGTGGTMLAVGQCCWAVDRFRKEAQ